ncbi:hypothetical protein CDAR_83151 [Caerostris darwini]|uniref:Uncharacterized protein n=1 Tax=Caerostris darwini TaxID=1538125 RepID=A0AAV4VM83_9ARAC|nr:hypothetical protein CDAR_83151 [Caerostris darwini]
MHSFGKNSKKRPSPAKQDLQSKKWTSDTSAGMLRKGDTPPRRDILQQNRIFNRRNGLQILQLEYYEKATHLQEETFSSKTGSSIEEMDFRSFSWNATKNCDSVSRRDTSKKRHSPAKQDLQSKKWTSDGMLLQKRMLQKTGSSIEEMDFRSFSWNATKIGTPPRRDILQQNRIFNRRNGLQILQLECYENCDSVSRRDTSEKRHSPAKQAGMRRDFRSFSWNATKIVTASQGEQRRDSKTGSSIEEMDFRSFSWNATKNCERRDTSKKRHSPAKQDLQSKKWTSDPSAGMLRKIATASQGTSKKRHSPAKQDLQSKKWTSDPSAGMQKIVTGLFNLQLECYEEMDFQQNRIFNRRNPSAGMLRKF